MTLVPTFDSAADRDAGADPNGWLIVRPDAPAQPARPMPLRPKVIRLGSRRPARHVRS